MAKDFPAIICDSSSLISITDACFIHTLYLLQKSFKGQFIIPPSVQYESIDHPRRVRTHAIYALRLARAVQDGILKVVAPKDTGLMTQLLTLANNSFLVEGKPLELIQAGETECLALAIETGVRDLLVDERTTRVLIESPDEFTEHLKQEFGPRLRVNSENLETFLSLCHSLRFYRSNEIVLLAYEKGYFNDYGPMKQEALEAALYRLKYSGCALSANEIEQGMEIETSNNGKPSRR
jgi:predicted nucleic acid-binding protein